MARTTLCAATRLIAERQGAALNHPLIGDSDLMVAKLYDKIHPNASGNTASGMAMDNVPQRSVFLIRPDKNIKLTMTYPMSAGRNFDEVLRARCGPPKCQAYGRHVGQLAPRRGCDHPDPGLRRRRQGQVPGRPESLRALSARRVAAEAIRQVFDARRLLADY